MIDVSIRRNDPCPCNSGKRYKHCCGKIEEGTAIQSNEHPIYAPNGYYKDNLLLPEQADICSDMPAGQYIRNNQMVEDMTMPPGVIVIEDFLSKEVCERFSEYVENAPGERLMVQDVDKSTPDKLVSKFDEQRITEYVAIDGIEEEVLAFFKDLHLHRMAPYYGVAFEWFERPQILRYGPGGKYNAHADAEYWNAQENRWVQTMDRDFGMLLYLNEEFTGGAVYFPNFDVRIQPKAGMFICFPSDHRYLHAAENLISGKRFALVSWSAALGTARVKTEPPAYSIFLSEES